MERPSVQPMRTSCETDPTAPCDVDKVSRSHYHISVMAPPLHATVSVLIDGDRLSYHQTEFGSKHTK